jgi:GPH family glycoside/pentoside/hexuronide:cation symporter
LKESLKFLLKSKYFYILIVLYVTLAITNGTAGIGVYFMRDVLGDANLLGIFSVISVAAMILTMPFVPKMFSKLGKRRTLLYGLGFVILVRVVMILLPTNLPVQLVCTFLSTVCTVPLWIATPTMICDLVDYGDAKNGIRTEGLTTSASSFGTKLGTGLGSVLLGIGLTVSNYDPLLQTQTDQTKNAIIFIMIGIPLALCLLCFICVFVWDME